MSEIPAYAKCLNVLTLKAKGTVENLHKKYRQMCEKRVMFKWCHGDSCKGRNALMAGYIVSDRPHPAPIEVTNIPRDVVLFHLDSDGTLCSHLECLLADPYDMNFRKPLDLIKHVAEDEGIQLAFYSDDFKGGYIHEVMQRIIENSSVKPLSEAHAEWLREKKEAAEIKASKEAAKKFYNTKEKGKGKGKGQGQRQRCRFYKSFTKRYTNGGKKGKGKDAAQPQ